MKNQKLLGFLAAGAFVLGGLAACGSGDIEDVGEMDEIFLESAESLIEGYVDEAVTAYQDCDTCDATGGTVEVSSESEETTESSDSESTEGGTTETSSTSTETSSASDITGVSSNSETAASSSSEAATVSSSSTATAVSSSSVATASSSSEASSSSVASSSSEAASSSSAADYSDGSTIDLSSSFSGTLPAGTYTLTSYTCGMILQPGSSGCSGTIDGTSFSYGAYEYATQTLSGSTATLILDSSCEISNLADLSYGC